MTQQLSSEIEKLIQDKANEIVNKVLHGSKEHRSWLEDELTPLIKTAGHELYAQAWKDVIECLDYESTCVSSFLRAKAKHKGIDI